LLKLEQLLERQEKMYPFYSLLGVSIIIAPSSLSLTLFSTFYSLLGVSF